MEAAIFSRERPTVGSMLSLTFKTFSTHFVPLSLIGVIAFMPMALMTAAQSLAKDNVSLWFVTFFVALIALMITVPAGYAAVLNAVFQAAQGRPVNVGQCLATGFRKLPRTIGVMFIATLLTMLGFMALIIPGIIAYLAFFLSVPVVAVEDVTVGGALSRSSDLIRGFRGMAFGTNFVLGLISWCFSFAVGLLIIMLGNQPVLSFFLNAIISGITGGLGIVAAGLIYFVVRANKESIGVDAIAAVFD
jgi:uncharacterized membrane protein